MNEKMIINNIRKCNKEYNMHKNAVAFFEHKAKIAETEMHKTAYNRCYLQCKLDAHRKEQRLRQELNIKHQRDARFIAGLKQKCSEWQQDNVARSNTKSAHHYSRHLN